MARRIIVYLVFEGLMKSLYGQTPTLQIYNASTEEGSSFTLNCSVTINDAITFKLDNVVQGSCGAPFLGILGSCTPNTITQSLIDSVTSWTISPAEPAHRGSWKCTLGTTDSVAVDFKVFKLPGAVSTTNGISSDTTVNDTSSRQIIVDVDCLISENGPTVELEFVVAGTVGASVMMSCVNSSTTCSTCNGCSAYRCIHTLILDPVLSSGEITTNIAYTLQIKVGVTGTTQTFSTAIFSPHTITFERTNSTSQISTVLSTGRTTTVKIYAYNNVTTPMSTAGMTPTGNMSASTTSYLHAETTIIYVNTEATKLNSNTETNNFYVNSETTNVYEENESTTSDASTESTKSYANTETTNFYAKTEFTISYANTETTNVYANIETTKFSTNTEINEIKKETSGIISKRMPSDQSIFLTTAANDISGLFLRDTFSQNMTAMFETPGYSVSSYNEITLSSTFKTNNFFSLNFSEGSISYLVDTSNDNLIRTRHVSSGSLITMDSSKYSFLFLTIPPFHVVKTYIATLSNFFPVQTVLTDLTDSAYEKTNTSRVSKFSLLTETGKTLTTISNVVSSAASTVFNSGRSESLLLSLSELPLMPTSLSFDMYLYSSNMLDSSFLPYQHSSETIVTLPKISVSNKLRLSILETMEHSINTKPILVTSNLVDTDISLHDLTTVHQTFPTEFAASYSTSFKDSFQAIDHSFSLQTSEKPYMHTRAWLSVTQFESLKGIQDSTTKFHSANFEPFSQLADEVFSLEMSEYFQTDFQSTSLLLPLNTITNATGIDPAFETTWHTTDINVKNKNLSSRVKHSSQHTNSDASYIEIGTSFKNSLFSLSSFSGSLMFDDPEITSVSSEVFKSISTLSTNVIKSEISEKTKNIIFMSSISALVTFIVGVLLTLVFARIKMSKDTVKPHKKNNDINWSDNSRSPMTVFPDYSFTGKNIHPLLNTSSTSFKMYPYEHNWNDIV